ncbi:ABC transporter ATP-binding protein [uncultured Jannaschia sp.]|uniref:ABC transporter ATP-binding protein n=1 Tax=uncultured Jannaschia sp. TaxID=293347 RepID=UPI00262D3DBF|nr:ABC transporter ATP-binding protein [uncultured Jannaschia sp.]
MADVTFTKVQKKFGTFTAVPGLDLDIRQGEFVSLLGPSGCGKTTTLRMLAGLEFPTSGEIRIGDRVVNDVAPGQRDIAMVFQSYALYPHMTVAENIAYPLKKRGVAKAERREMVARTAEMLQITPLLGRKPKELSGGQQQRVALGRALVRDPKVFLLDEPLSNLDAKLRGYMRGELIELHQRLGRTMVYVTHDQLEAMTMSDRIAVMEGGKLQQFAPPQDVYREPANRFVAGFIGTPGMTLIDGELSRSGADWRFDAPGISVPALGLGDLAEPGPAAMGLRPEALTIGTGDIAAEIQLVEQTGHENIVIVRVGEIRLTGRTQPHKVWSPGDRVGMAIDPGMTHFFAAGPTGARLNAPLPPRVDPAAAFAPMLKEMTS